jgi:hypothetical protein
MLPNEKFALACRAYYEEQGLIVDKTNGEFAHCPLPRSECETGYYLLWEHHQHQGLLQSRDVGRRCFLTGLTKKWLLTANYFPDNYFELWDIFENYAKPTHDLSYLNSPEVFAKRGATMKRNLSKLLPAERKQKTKEANIARQKPIRVYFPNGRIGTYPSLKFAAECLSCTPENIKNRVDNPSQRGMFKNFRFELM